MARRIWKTIAPLLVLITALMGVFVFLCVGCGSDEDTNGANDISAYDINEHLYYVVFDDGNGQTYKIGEGNKKTVSYEYAQGVQLKFTYKIYNHNDRMVVNNTLPRLVDLSVSGEEDIKVSHYTKEHGTEWTTLTVGVKEKPRLTPEVSFDPNGAIDYVANEKYVYKYDGYIHHPSALLSYNGNNIELNRDCVITIDSNVKSNNSFFVIDVGVYTVYYLIDDFCMENESDKGKYSVISTSVIVEIVE